MPRRPQPPRLTPTARLVLDCIIQHKIEHDGDSPTLRELMEIAGLSSTSVAHYQLGKLERLGLIARMPDKPRCIRVTGGEWRMNGKDEQHERINAR